MIRLEVEPYCDHCEMFDADVERPEKAYSGTEEFILGDTVIRCKRRKLCSNLKRYLEKENGHD